MNHHRTEEEEEIMDHDLYWEQVHHDRHRLSRSLVLSPDRSLSRAPRRIETATLQKPIVQKLLSNCHNTTLIGSIGIGTPPQFFMVAFDTSTSVSWIPSVKCDQTCHYRFRSHFASSNSSTHSSVNSTEFREQFLHRESIGGFYVHDTIHLAVDLSLPHQVFAELTNYDTEDVACVGQGGRLGLGIDPFTLDFFGNERPPFATSLLAELTRQLPFPIFSLYINAFDDFVTYDYFPDFAKSEIIFGGVNHQHYEGCIEWHTPSHIPATEALWNIGLNHISVANTTIPMNNAIILDSTISNVIGLPNDVGRVAAANDITCYHDGYEGDGLFPTDCHDPNGFDSASIDCNRRIADVEFVLADGQSYRLTHEDLVVETYIDLIGFMCMVRISSDPDVPGWMLGQVFFHRHYVVFNIENRNVGLALSTSSGGALCEADRAMDISSYTEDEDLEDEDPLDAATPGSGSHSFGGGESLDINFAPSRNETLEKSWKVEERQDDLVLVATIAGFAAVVILLFLISFCRRRIALRSYQRTEMEEMVITKEEEETEESETELL